MTYQSPPRLPDLNPSIPDTNSIFELKNAVVECRLVAVLSWSKANYYELCTQQEAYDQLMLAKERLSHPDYKFYKCNIDDMEAKKVRGMLGVHPKVVNESAGLSIYKDGELIGSLEGEEMRTYGLIEKALNSVQ